MQPFRIAPKLPPQAVKTYQIASPKETHTRVAKCVEVDCKLQSKGFQTLIDEATIEGQRRGAYIRRHSGRRFTEARNEHGITVFTFAPGSECFLEHRVSIDRPEIFAVRGGDWRGNPRGEVRVHDKPEHWVEDFSQHQSELIKAQE